MGQGVLDPETPVPNPEPRTPNPVSQFPHGTKFAASERKKGPQTAKLMMGKEGWVQRRSLSNCAYMDVAQLHQNDMPILCPPSAGPFHSHSHFHSH